MASFLSSHGHFLIVVLISSFQLNLKAAPVKQLFPYHAGPLLSGNISVNLIWYGRFNTAQRAIVLDFIAPLSKPTAEQPSVASWLKLTDKFYEDIIPINQNSRCSTLRPGHPHSDCSPRVIASSDYLSYNNSLGKLLTSAQLYELAKNGGKDNLINVLLTSVDVMVEGFCRGRCRTHAVGTGHMNGNTNRKFIHIWVGNSETQCPDLCAWPFHESLSGPKTPPLKAPNGDIGLDGMVINVASLLAGTVTNPFDNGFFLGTREAALEASTACPGVFGKKAFPGFAGKLLVDSKTNGINGKKFLLPVIVDPDTSTCTTLV